MSSVRAVKRETAGEESGWPTWVVISRSGEEVVRIKARHLVIQPDGGKGTYLLAKYQRGEEAIAAFPKELIGCIYEERCRLVD